MNKIEEINRKRKEANARLARFALEVMDHTFEENQKYTIQNLDFFGKFRVRAAFPMHGQAGNTRYLDFRKAMQARFSGFNALELAAWRGKKDVVDYLMEALEINPKCSTVNAGHPGGTFPLTEREAVSLHHASLPLNAYLTDATLLPRSLGNPPILTIIALAKRVGKLCRENMG